MGIDGPSPDPMINIFKGVEPEIRTPVSATNAIVLYCKAIDIYNQFCLIGLNFKEWKPN